MVQPTLSPPKKSETQVPVPEAQNVPYPVPPPQPRGRPDRRNPILPYRIVSAGLGLMVLGIGLHSYFLSAWNSSVISEDYGEVKVHKVVCGLLKDTSYSCPSITMEHYYVGVIISSLILSFLGLTMSFLIDLSSTPWKYIDIGYHAVASVLLFIAAIVYAVSAEQIEVLPIHWDALDSKLLTGEKRVAAGFTIVQSLFCGIIATMNAIGRRL